MNQNRHVIQSISTGGHHQIIVSTQSFLSPDQRIFAQPGQQIKTIEQTTQLKIQQSHEATIKYQSTDQVLGHFRQITFRFHRQENNNIKSSL
jgi:hypothetical protein